MADVNNLVTSGLPPRSPGSLMSNGKRSDSNNTATTIFPSWLSSVQCPSSHSTSASNSFALIKRPETLDTDDKVTDPTLENDKNKKIENSLPQPSKTPSSESIVAVKTEPSLDTDAKRNNMDQKMKRILANRQSAHRSRMKKLQHVTNLEKRRDSLEAEVARLSPQLLRYQHQRLQLKVESTILKQKMSSFMGEQLLKEAQFEALKEERERLRQLLVWQQEQQHQQQSQRQQQLKFQEKEQKRLQQLQQQQQLQEDMFGLNPVQNTLQTNTVLSDASNSECILSLESSNIGITSLLDPLHNFKSMSLARFF